VDPGNRLANAESLRQVSQAHARFAAAQRFDNFNYRLGCVLVAEADN
jgi:hypothetical protein